MIYTHAGRDATSTYNDFHDPGLLAATLPVACKIGPLEPSTASTSPPQQQQQQPQQGPPERVKPPLGDLINLHDFAAAFAVEGSAKTQAYIGGAANDELTLRANLDHWARLSFRPRVLRDVSRVATRSTMLGCDVRSPVFIAPMGLGRTGGPEAEAALGRGAQAAGLVHCVSTMASLSLGETLSAAPGHPFWFQLYVDRDRRKTEVLLRQVRDLPQVRAILFTVDLPVVSKREADERVRNAAANAAGSFASGITGRRGADDAKGGGLARTTGSFIDATLTWADVPWVRRNAGGLPVLAKGIQSAADARLALRAGCDGIVVSNHGGRALDGAPSSVLVLLELRRDCPEVFTRMEVYVDGGVRRGSDVLKAVCLGARGVGVGRPFQYAIGYGTEGVQKCANSEWHPVLS